MGKIVESGLPSFFDNDEDDENKKDKGQETLQDFFLSWTLHCAEDKFREINLNLQEYARKIIFTLINGYNDIHGEFVICKNKKINDSFKVINVATWREWKYIDIVAEIEIEENNISKKYVFNIEDKYYTRIREGQLEKSKKYITEEYNGKDFEIISMVIFSDKCIIEEDPSQLQKCIENGYKLLSLIDIKTMTEKMTEMNKHEKTGNVLFDEFWFY